MSLAFLGKLPRRQCNWCKRRLSPYHGTGKAHSHGFWCMMHRWMERPGSTRWTCGTASTWVLAKYGRLRLYWWCQTLQMDQILRYDLRAWAVATLNFVFKTSLTVTSPRLTSTHVEGAQQRPLVHGTKLLSPRTCAYLLKSIFVFIQNWHLGMTSFATLTLDLSGQGQCTFCMHAIYWFYIYSSYMYGCIYYIYCCGNSTTILIIYI